MYPQLPIDTILDEIAAALHAGSSAVLVAPPGAGKTTRVPLAMLEQARAPGAWLGEQRILVLEPRRLAARGAAAQMARLLGERLGETIGLRTRLATHVSARTRVEVITEGVFTRMILDDPILDGIGAVLFDEFHERSLDADLGLALALDTQSALRPDLRLLVMSATIDGGRVARLMDDAPVITCEGRSFPVGTRYLGRSPQARLEDQMTAAIGQALSEEPGSILAFLPGQAEIRRTAERLGTRITDPSVVIAPLYGGLDLAEQDRAIAPAAVGQRKVVLATSIAETSLTIEGVRVVIDCGQSRVPAYEPGTGLTRLETVRVSRAAADQRRGRAGRLEPGVCYRLWAEPETHSLPAFAEPEIRNADLSSLLLDCAAWGVTDPATLRWLDPPPSAALAVARAGLVALGALGDDGRLTPLGEGTTALPLPPRLAAMLLRAAATGNAEPAAAIAAVLVERGLGGTDTDLERRLSAFRSERSRRADDMRRLSRAWARTANRIAARIATGIAGGRAAEREMLSPAALLALAYPDRVAKARGVGGQYLLANGRGAMLDEHDPLSRTPYLAVAEITGSAAAGRIRLAATLDERELKQLFAYRITEQTETFFDTAAGSVKCRRQRCLGALVLAVEPRPVVAGDEVAGILCDGIVAAGIDRLPWTKAQRQWRERIEFLRSAPAVGATGGWPDVSDAGLARLAGAWLLPFLAGKTTLAQVGADDLAAGLDTLVPWELRQRLDREAPTHFAAPTGNRFSIEYSGPLAPRVAIRVQELFGLARHPSVGGDRLPLTLELLSPAHRPIQITRDLPGFWAGSWADTRADMRGQYPKHEWPEDPAHATPTARAKPRGT